MNIEASIDRAGVYVYRARNRKSLTREVTT
jgi:hypothetical protein